jgi:23S rRNA pseudouridine2605 synthase
VRIRGDLNDAGREAVLRGELDDGSLLRVEGLEASGDEGDASNRWYHVRAQGPSGKAIRQLFERQGVVVSRVMRTGLGDIRLTRDLGRGHFRELLPEEAAALEPPPASESRQPEAAPRRRRPAGQAGPRPSRPAPGRASAERRAEQGERSDRAPRAGQGGGSRSSGRGGPAARGRPGAQGRRSGPPAGPFTGRRKSPR